MGIPIPNEVRDLINSITGVAGVLSSHGWAEAGAGNISVNVTDLFTKPLQGSAGWKNMDAGSAWDDAHPAVLLVTARGARMRQIAARPADHLCLVQAEPQSVSVRFTSLSKAVKDALPSSELTSHLMIHGWLARHNPSAKVLLHAHATPLIALSHIIGPGKKEELNSLLWSMHTETVHFIPEGVGYVGFAEPGSRALAVATLEEFKHHRILLWEKHGCIAAHETPDLALDLVEVASRAAEIFLLSKQSGKQIAGLDASQVARLRKMRAF